MPALSVPEAFLAANGEYTAAYERGDAAGVAAVHTAGARIFPPGHGPVEGRDAIRDYWQLAMDQGFTKLRLMTEEFVVLGEIAVEFGRYTFGTDDSPEADHGRYTVAWQREGDAWRWHRNLWNSSAALP